MGKLIPEERILRRNIAGEYKGLTKEDIPSGLRAGGSLMQAFNMVNPEPVSSFILEAGSEFARQKGEGKTLGEATRGAAVAGGLEATFGLVPIVGSMTRKALKPFVSEFGEAFVKQTMHVGDKVLDLIKKINKSSIDNKKLASIVDEALSTQPEMAGILADAKVLKYLKKEGIDVDPKVLNAILDNETGEGLTDFVNKSLKSNIVDGVGELTEKKIKNISKRITTVEGFKKELLDAGLDPDILETHMRGDIIGNYDVAQMSAKGEMADFLVESGEMTREELEAAPIEYLQRKAKWIMRGFSKGDVQDFLGQKMYAEIHEVIDDTARKTAKNLSDKQIVDLAKTVKTPEESLDILAQFADKADVDRLRGHIKGNYENVKQFMTPEHAQEAVRQGFAKTTDEYLKAADESLQGMTRRILRGIKEGKKDNFGLIAEIGD